MNFKIAIIFSIRFFSIVTTLFIQSFSYLEIISKIERREISFKLYSWYSETPYFLIPGNKINVFKSPFEPGFQTKIIIHGYQSSCKETVFIKIKEAYFLKFPEYNIICVDWSLLANSSYLKAIHHVWLVGISLSVMLDWLVQITSLELEDVHIIGHSLGAHVAGVAGYHTELGIVGRITGLDPAVPMIIFTPESTLDMSDALIVEMMFTSILSYGHPLGHINYYLNGGLWQPSCAYTKIAHKRSERQLIGGENIVCSHSKAHEVFAEAILCPKCFPAVPCPDVSSAIENKCCKHCEGSYFIFDLDSMNYGVYFVNEF